MEYASYLAGEKWSDHPQCTDPVLAALARAVNDLISDRRRQELLPDVPRVIGLVGIPSGDLLVAVSAAASALPVASMDRQHALAVGLLAARDALERERGVPDALRARVDAALEAAPGAVAWVQRHPEFAGPLAPGRHLHAALEIVRVSALGVAEACVADMGDRLIALLREAIGTLEAERVAPVDVEAAVPQPATAPEPEAQASAVPVSA